MGLLSDPEAGGARWAGAVVRAEGLVCTCAWLLAIGWLLALSHPAFNNKTYFSENALLPGLVRGDWSDDRVARRLYTELLEELQDKYSQRENMPVPWLVGKMSQLRLETYTHNFTLNYPLGHKQVYRGTNVYGILRAPRAAALEALVVSVPYRALSSHNKGTAAGLALVLAYAQLARSQRYWAKDIIFVVTEHEQLGMQAWLEAYHGSGDGGGGGDEAGRRGGWYGSLGGLVRDEESGGRDARRREGAWLRAGVLPARSGAIQAAVNLEIHAPDIKFLEVKPEGLNGQLSNLDLVNLVHKMCDKSSVQHAYRHSYSWRKAYTHTWGIAHTDLRTLLGQLAQQVTGVPSGNHGLFHRYGIEAVTLEGRDASDSPHAADLPPANFYRLGNVLEGTLRSLNNLLERFHQSYFFYLVTRIDRFASIGQYMPSLCLPVGALLVRALALWIGDTTRHAGADTTRHAAADTTQHTLQLAANYIALHAAGYLLMVSPAWFSRIGADYWGWPTEVSVYYGCVCACVMLAAVCACVRARAELLAPASLELATLCLAVGMHNISLGLALATLYTPLALLTSPVRGAGWPGTVRHRAKQVLCLALHPLALLTAGLSLYSLMLFPEEPALSALGRGTTAAHQALLFSVVDSLIYGNWLWNVSCVLLLPVWCVLWQTLCAASTEQPGNSKCT